MCKWDDYVYELLRELKRNSKAIVVGITGSHIRRNSNDKSLRVYMNGGRILRISLSEGEFEFGKDYLEEKYLYLDRDEQDTVQKIMDIVSTDCYAWKDNNYKLLNEYLYYMDKATKKKYGTLKHSNTSKERMYQINLFKKLVENDTPTYTFIDVEFQTIAEMNYPAELIQEWIKQHGHTKGMHRGRTDYIAIHEGGFFLIELKTNKDSLNGSAGIQEHRDDFENLIKMNQNNYILARELKERLQVMYDYELIKDSSRNLAENVLNMDIYDLKIEERYLFITNELLTKEMCEAYIKEKGIDKNKVIFQHV